MLAAAVWLGLDRYISPSDSKERKDFVQLVVQTLGVMALAVAAYLTLRRVRAAEDAVRTSEVGQITERFTRAIEQLGGDKLAVRLGGIYALERIAIASEGDHWPIMEVLTAYVRDQAPISGADSPVRMPAPDIQAILTVIGRRKRTFGNGEVERLDLSATNLAGINLADGQLGGVKLFACNLERADLQGAHLEGADLRSAHMNRANLSRAHLDGANLNGADLEEALLINSTMEGTSLHDANLKRAWLNNVNLKGLKLIEAHWEGAVVAQGKCQG